MVFNRATLPGTSGETVNPSPTDTATSSGSSTTNSSSNSSSSDPHSGVIALGVGAAVIVAVIMFLVARMSSSRRKHREELEWDRAATAAAAAASASAAANTASSNRMASYSNGGNSTPRSFGRTLGSGSQAGGYIGSGSMMAAGASPSLSSSYAMSAADINDMTMAAKDEEANMQAISSYYMPVMVAPSAPPAGFVPYGHMVPAPPHHAGHHGHHSIGSGGNGGGYYSPMMAPQPIAYSPQMQHQMYTGGLPNDAGTYMQPQMTGGSFAGVQFAGSHGQGYSALPTTMSGADMDVGAAPRKRTAPAPPGVPTSGSMYGLNGRQ
ncbi:hypothetical protein BC828DRAFT_379833 [Blastocladiella britannica]|nr:hypothetical protein BC828DRAFT_379833 [Blastocladiella britannica]